MSGGLPEAKPWANCCPRSDATTTFNWMANCVVDALAAALWPCLLRGAGAPQIGAVTVSASLRWREPKAAPAVMASAPTMTSASDVRQRAV